MTITLNQIVTINPEAVGKGRKPKEEIDDEDEVISYEFLTLFDEVEMIEYNLEDDYGNNLLKEEVS